MPLAKRKVSKKAKLKNQKNDKNKKKPREPSPHQNALVAAENPGIYSTPVRKRRLNRETNTSNKSMNITNLNILFDSEFIYNAESNNDVFIDKTNSTRKRSLSSISKFSSIQGEPFRKHQCTQTADENELIVTIHNEETPKCGDVYRMKKTDLEKPMHESRHKLNGNIFRRDVNINPYLRNIEDNIGDGSYTEASFFCPNLFRQYSSTPIPTIGSHRGLVVSPKSPKFNASINLTTTSGDKLLRKSSSLRSLKHSINISTRRKIIRYSSKEQEKKDQYKCNNANCINNSSINELLESHGTGCYQNIFSKIKSYFKLTNWTGKVVNVCFHLGVHLKNTLSSIYNAQNNASRHDYLITCDKCKQNEEQISKLSLKVAEIENTNKKNFEQLNEELKKIKDDLHQLANVKIEMDCFKEELELIKSKSSARVVPAPPPPPPPPPMPSFIPPPPPPPMFNATPSDSSKLKISKKKHNMDDKENSRPVISLEDILKVKLKKTSHSNSYQATPTSRPNNQPAVSLEMLRQVKLKPSNGSRRSEGDTLGLDVPLSPTSNLCRLLKSEMSAGRRLKRLRKIGGLNCDSVYRRRLDDRREREYD
ncbi:unnamed protein product [Phyllotreta striolata]|uniref:Uncharacterized protein n=1 Tax=Phyllotreta striolata TaxID=444603 RepID=A0A9N9TPM4_PHYSR|nr:unnamed protein product [Phyllotreta striolata]